MTLQAGGWIDVSVPIRPEMPTWPDQPRVWVNRLQTVEDDGANVSVVSMTTHSGTHVDAPLHFLEDADPVTAMPPRVGLGRAEVFEVEDLDTIKPEHVAQLPEDASRVLFKTDNSDRCWRREEFVEDYVHLSTGAAEALVDRGVQLVGIDYLSIGGYQGNIAEVHERLLGNDVWILEGLDLSQAPAGEVELACLPLRLEGGDGAPARALVRPRS